MDVINKSADMKQCLCVPASLVNQFLGIFPADFSDAFGRIGNQRRIVPLSPKGYGRHIRTVCFQEQPVFGNHFCYFDGDARIFERNCPSEPDIQAQFEDFARHLHTSGEAVDDAARPEFLQQLQGIAVSRSWTITGRLCLFASCICSLKTVFCVSRGGFSFE